MRIFFEDAFLDRKLNLSNPVDVNVDAVIAPWIVRDCIIEVQTKNYAEIVKVRDSDVKNVFAVIMFW